jgi:hypothetical protein
VKAIQPFRPVVHAFGDLKKIKQKTDYLQSNRLSVEVVITWNFENLLLAAV